MTATLRELFGYHAWANGDLFDKLETLDTERQAATLHDALRLINHSHVVARIFAGHLSGRPHGYLSDNTAETPTLGALRAAVAASDRWYLDYLHGMPAPDLFETIAFTFTDGDDGAMTRAEMLLHVALHAGYHRGEAGRLLSQASVTPPWDTFAVYLHRREPSRRTLGAKPAA